MEISVQDLLQKTFTFPGYGHFWIIQREVWEEISDLKNGRSWPYLIKTSEDQARHIHLLINNSPAAAAFVKKATNFYY